MEAGPLTEREITRRLAGHVRLPQMEAVLSLLEWTIGDVRALAEVPGCNNRDELCGAAYQLKALRARLLNMLAAEPSPDA